MGRLSNIANTMTAGVLAIQVGRATAIVVLNDLLDTPISILEGLISYFFSSMCTRVHFSYG